MPLVLDLLRHGDALPSAEGGDSMRRLSPRGEQDLERLASHLAGLGWRPDLAFSSPLHRAIESARLVLRRAAPGLEPAVMDALRPDAPVATVARALAEARVGDRHVLLVGHQPLLGELVRWGTRSEVSAPSPGELLRLEFAAEPVAGTGRLQWRVRGQDCG